MTVNLETTAGRPRGGARFIDWLTGRRSRSSLQLRILLLVVVILCVASAILSPVFLSRRNILNVLQQVAVLEIVAIGTLFVMISGGIDLSIGNIISFVAGTAAILITRGVNPALVVVIALLLGMGSGYLNGTIITKSRCEPFIITLGMMSVYEGLAFIVVNGRNIGLIGTFQVLGRGSVGIVPIPVIAFVLVDLVMFVVLKFTRFGRKVYSIGGNEEAAFLAGIRISLYKPLIYMINGLIVGIAAVILLSRGWRLQSPHGCRLRAAGNRGGRHRGCDPERRQGQRHGGLPRGPAAGGDLQCPSLMDVPYFYQYVTLGVLIVGAVILSNINKPKRG